MPPPASVTLVFPRLEYQTGDPPLGVAYLAAVLRRARPDLQVHIVDGTFLGDERALLAAIRATRPRVAGFFVDSLSAPRARRLSRALRAECRTMAGGPMASVTPRALAPDFDVVVIGEAEELIAPLVTALLDGTALDALPNLVWREEPGALHESPQRACGPDLDALPWPAWDLLDMPRYIRRWPYLDSLSLDIPGTNLVASRGCPWACTYCQPTLDTVFGDRLRRRSPASVVAEIEALQERYGIRGLFFHDDTLLANRSWTLALCEALASLRRPMLWGCNSRADLLEPEIVDAMVRAGLRSVHIGVEAGSERVRREVYGKTVDIARLERSLAHLERRGVSALGFFMLGAPTESLAEMGETVRLARRLRLTEATFSLTAVLPGTRLHERVATDPRFLLLGAEGADYYNRRNFVDREMLLPEGGLRAVQLGALAAFYLHPRRRPYLLSHLGSRRGLVKLLSKLERFLR